MDRFDHGGDVYALPKMPLDFSVNTNPLGMPKPVLHALRGSVESFVRYPDPYCRELTAALALHEGVPGEWILCGNGAADLLYRLCYALRPRRALVCAPTFSEYGRALAQVGCQIEEHSLLPENGFALTAAIGRQITPGLHLLFLCQPNNPTGRLIPQDVLSRVLSLAAQNGTYVVVDECFLDFTTAPSCKRFLREMPGLIVVKALTKTYALAGLRLGYLLTSDAALRERVSMAGACWSVSVPAQTAGVAALGCADWQERTRALVAQERAFLAESLSALGITVFPGDANFLLVRSEQPLYSPLLERGILVRSCASFAGLDESYTRVAVKTRQENMRLLQAVKEMNHG